MTTTPPPASPPKSSVLVAPAPKQSVPVAEAPTADITQHRETVGAWLAGFIADEAPLAAAVAASLWNHFSPGLVQMFVPASTIGDAVKSALNGLSGAVKDQVVAFSVPSGFLSDTLTYIEQAIPGTIKAIEHFVEPGITAAAKALGILPPTKS